MKYLTDVTAAILAGGFGTRLHPVVVGRPKVLAEIQGRPFLAYLLDQVVAIGVRHVVLCTGYLGEQVQATLGNAYGGLHLSYSKESVPLGTAGALKFAMPLFRSDPILVMNGDSICQANLEAFWAWHQTRIAHATILLTEVADTKRYGRVDVDAHGRVIHFVEKDDNGVSGWINAGIYLIHRNLLQTIPSDRSVSLEREILPSWIGQGLYGYLSRGFFLDIGTPEAYASVKRYFTGGSGDGTTALCCARS